MECRVERRYIFWPELECPGRKRPADFFFHHFQQQLPVGLSQQLRGSEIRQGLFKGIHVNTKRDAKKKRRMRGARKSVTVTATIRQRAKHRAKVKAANPQFA